MLRFRFSRPVGTVVRKEHQVQYLRSRKRKQVQLLPWNTNPSQNLQRGWRCRCVHVWQCPLCANFYEFYTMLLKCVCNSQVTDVSSKLKEMQFYWIQLPSALCSGKTASSTNGDKCWNGITKARYCIFRANLF